MINLHKLKKIILYTLFLFTVLAARAQKIDSIYVNLYTDSLKKGTFNYINVDGLLRNGRYLPLDSTHLLFQASAGSFSGNSLWIDRDFTGEKVHITVVLRSNRAISREFDVYIKKKENTEQLKTADQVIYELKKGGKKKKGN
jgi:hypothetical protein